ncbi:MAG: hypothetical protein IJ637_04785, partial [Prevotella sp.]|nr:hypothetical protein [Prevotella sp.]
MRKYIYNKVKAMAKGILPFYLSALLPLVTSCDDFLTTPSKSALSTETSYGTPAQIDDALTGV